MSFIHFTHGFRSLHWSDRVNIFLEIVLSKTATTHIFQSGVRNWPASVSRREIEVFNPQARELAGIEMPDKEQNIEKKQVSVIFWTFGNNFFEIYIEFAC